MHSTRNYRKRAGGFTRWVLAILGLALIMVVPRLYAQVDQGAITGAVTDPTGGVIPTATVTIKNVDTGFTLTDKVDGGGVYTFSPIKIGRYTVSASAPGFASVQQDNVRVDIASRVSVPLKLSVGGATEVVEVTTAPPLLQTADGSTGQVIEAQTIVNTPLNGRNFAFIAQLTAGVAPGNGSRGSGKGDFSANGQRSEQNNFILDGVDNNVNVVDFFNGASFNVKPPPEALAEFKVQTGAYSAEYGHSAGAVVNVSVKSGTNKIHGSAWEYIRNDAFDIHQWQDAPGTVPKYRQNQFGGTIGFPIIKDKLFFFGDAEADRIIFGETGLYTVPTALMRTGNFSELLNPSLLNTSTVQLIQPNAATKTQPLTGNILTTNQINTTAQKILNLYPNPNFGGGRVYNNYQSNRNATDNTTQYDIRVDYNASAKDQAFIRASSSNDPGIRTPPLGQILDGGGFGDTGTIVNLGEALAASETHVFNSNLTNELRFGYNYGNFGFQQPNANTQGVAAGIGLGGIPGGTLNGGLPNVAIGGISGFGSPTFAVTNEYQNVFQILDNVTKIIGSHTLRVGVNFQHIRFSTTQPTQPRGSYNFSGKFTSDPAGGTLNGANVTGFGVADFLTNNMDTAAISNVFTSDDARWVRAGYVQDDWRATSRLTLNVGLRYEFAQPYLERHDNQAVFNASSTGLGTGVGTYTLPASKQNVALAPIFLNLLSANHIALQYSNNRALVNSQKNNFAPRFGLAFKATDKLVVRTGYGIFFGGLESTGYYPNLGENFPFEFDSNFNAANINGTCSPGNCKNNGILLETGFTAQIAAGLQNSLSTPALRGSDLNVKTPYSQQYNLSTEYALTNNLSAGLAYVGSVSRHLVVFPDPNSPGALIAPGISTSTVEAFPGFGGTAYSRYIGSSNYNSLQAKLDQRFRRGLSFLATYTYAHSLDDAPTPLGSTGDAGYRNATLTGIGADYSNSPFDVRHRVTLNGTYDIPFGVGRQYGNHHGLIDILLGGFTNSLTFVAQTGQPFSINSGIATANGAGAHPTIIRDPFAPGGGPGCPTVTRTTTHWYNPCSFVNPPSNTVITGNQRITGQAAIALLGSPRNTVYGPGYQRINGSLFKNFGLFHETSLQLRADYFNLLNTPAYGNPDGNIGNPAGGTPSGGVITSNRSLGQFYPDSRFFQFAAKVNF